MPPLASAKLWPHGLLTVVALAPSTALWNYAPSIVASFGYAASPPMPLRPSASGCPWCLVIILGFVA